MSHTELIDLFRNLGFPAALLVYLLWRLDQKFVPAIEAMAETAKKNAEHLEALTGQLKSAATDAKSERQGLVGMLKEAITAAHQAATNAEEAKEAADRAAASVDHLAGLISGAIAAEAIVPHARTHQEKSA